MQADTAFSFKVHNTKFKQISLFTELSFCSALKEEKKWFAEAENHTPIAHEHYIKYNLESICSPSWVGPQNESVVPTKRTQKRTAPYPVYLRRAVHTEALVGKHGWKLANCFGRTASTGTIPIFEELSWRWQLGQMGHAASIASLLIHQPGAPLLICQMEINSVTSSKQSLTLKRLSDSSDVFHRELKGLSAAPEPRAFELLVPRYTGQATQGLLHTNGEECRGESCLTLCLPYGHNCDVEWNLEISFQKHT